MITLITGIPGMGKTSLLVSMLLEYEKAAERPLFVMGIPDLKLEHIVAPPVEEWTEWRKSEEDQTLELAYFTFPPNSILIVDEAQRVFRPRSSASKVPAYVAALETHRHTGLDIILLTQKPKLIDVNVRELVGRHIHIRSGLLGRHLLEWPHIADGESRADRSDAVRRRFKPPKESFKNYKSAEIHTKHKFRLHQMWVYLGLALLVGAYQLHEVMAVLDKNINPDRSAFVQAQPRTGAVQAGTNAASPFPNAQPPMIAPDAQNHPYLGSIFTIAGTLNSPRLKRVYVDVLLPDSKVVHTTSAEMINAGYTFIPISECLALIKFGTFEASAHCRSPVDQNSAPFNPLPDYKKEHQLATVQPAPEAR